MDEHIKSRFVLTENSAVDSRRGGSLRESADCTTFQAVKRKLIISIIVLTLFPVVYLTGQSTWDVNEISGNNLVVKLATASPGDELYTWWGHSAIIIENTVSGESKFYNYGLFSFDQEHFYSNFVQGRLLFEVGAFPTRPALKVYKARDRTVHVQTLGLRPDRRRALLQYLEMKIQPENRQYLYDHYYDNCSTRVRDLIDRFSGGALRKATKESAETTFREQTRRFTERNFAVDFLLMYLMGGVIDQEMTEWETMFLPSALEREVETVEIRNEKGETVPLVSETVVWYESEAREPIRAMAAPLWPKTLATGGVIGLLLAVSLVLLIRRIPAGNALFGVVTALLGFIAGLTGTLLLYMSLFTDHVVTYWNENLILTNPITLAFIPLGILVTSKRPKGVRVLAAIASFHTAALVVLVLLKLLFPETFVQGNFPVLLFFSPIYLFLTIDAWVLARNR